MKQKLSVTIGLFGPSDTNEHITQARQEIESISRAWSRRDLLLEAVHWSTDAVPGHHSSGPQGKIDDDLRIDEVDVALFVFWQRFGTPTLGFQSGTEHEFERILERRRISGAPSVLVYFDESYNSNAEGEQLANVQTFRRKLQDKKELLYRTVSGTPSFRAELRNHLDRVLEEILSQYQQSIQAYGDELMCIVSASQRIVRAEGFSERLGDSRLAFRLPGREIAKDPILVDIVLTTSVPITNRIVGEERLIDCILIDDRTEAPMASAYLLNATQLLFEKILVMPEPAIQSSRLRIVNLRGAIPGAAAPNGSVFANVSVYPRGNVYTQPSEAVQLSPVHQGLLFSAKRADGRRYNTPIPARPVGEEQVSASYEPNIWAEYEEGFAGAFRNEDGEKSGLPGISDYLGTQFRLEVSTSSPDVKIWVTRTNVRSSVDEHCQAQLVEINDEALDSTFQSKDAENRTVLVRLQQSQYSQRHTGTVTWEWVDSAAPSGFRNRRKCRFGIVLEAQGTLSGEITIQGSLAPINSTACASGAGVPVPRYQDTSTPVGFRFGT